MPKVANKIIYGGQVLLDLTGDDVQASDVLAGKKFHLPSGAQGTGSCTFDADTSDANAVAAEILSGKTAYKNGSKLTGTMPNRGSQTGGITDKTQPIAIQQGYHDGGGSIGIDATEAAKLIAENIRENVSILGVTGSMSGSEDMKPVACAVTPYTTAQTILPADIQAGKNCISQVTVAAIAYTETENDAGGLTVTIGTTAPAA